MINYKIIKSIDELKIDKNNEDFLNHSLYHGTRMNMLKMDDDERKLYYGYCKLLLQYVNDFSVEIYEIIKDRLRDVTSYWAVIMQYKSSALYEYGPFYMTVNKKLAEIYCNNVGGELGQLAYECTKIIENANIEITEEVKKAANYMK